MDAITFILAYIGAAATAYIITRAIVAMDYPSHRQNRKENTK